MALDWDILDDDCSSLATWTVANGTGTLTQTTFDGKSCFKLNCAVGQTYAFAYHTPDVYPGDTFTMESNVYMDAGGGGSVYIFTNVNSGASPYDAYTLLFKSFSATRPAFVSLRTGASAYKYATIGDDGRDKWYNIRLVVKTGRKASVWVDNICLMADIVCSNTATGARDVYIQAGSATPAAAILTAYIDTIRVDTTPEHPTTESQLKIGTEDLAVRPNQVHYTASWVDTEKFKVYGKSLSGSEEVLEVPLVATDDVNASDVRVYDGTTTKALMKLPS